MATIEQKKNKLLLDEELFYGRYVQKLSFHKLGELHHLTHPTVALRVRRYAQRCELATQDIEGLICFYETEIIELKAKRQTVNMKSYVGISRLIMELQDKIAELLRMKNTDTPYKFPNLQVVVVNNNGKDISDKEKRQDRDGDFIQGEAREMLREQG